jgi:hypothetical protein
LLELEEQFLAEVNAKLHTLSDALDIAKTKCDELADLIMLQQQK